MENSDNQEVERTKAIDAILGSSSRHKVIVAGPGTGKTFLFKEICKKKRGDILALTFINNLANDLKNDLGELAECCTFHALCKKLIYQLPVPLISKFAYFPKIDAVVDSDRSILEPDLGKAKDAFEDWLRDDPRITLFIQRAKYYKAVGHTDGVYQVTNFLSENPQMTPVYSQVLVDEFQDFNRLEVEMIQVLGKASPTLIVGDDDQALYDFKRASPSFLRAAARDGNNELFDLPYCSRCTKIIVDSVNHIIAHAKSAGMLNGRIDKPFKCFLPEKGNDSARYPKIIYAKCSVQQKKAPYMSRYIVSEIESIVAAGYKPEYSRGVWDFIIAGPNHYLRGLEDILTPSFPNTFRSGLEPTELLPQDGYLELLRKIDSDIGWRATLNFYRPDILQKVVQKSRLMKRPIRYYIPKAVQEDTLNTMLILTKLKKGESINAFEETRLLEVFAPNDIDTIRSIFCNHKPQPDSGAAKPEYRIRISSTLGCKGLTANYVFLVGLNDGVLPRNPGAPTDYEVCKFIVGLTRARKKCYLISVRNLLGKWQEESAFIRWLDKSFLEELYVDKKYFR